jgi:uncharacterized membrane protein
MFISDRSAKYSQSNKINQSKSYFSNKFRFLIVIVLLIGFFFRFVNIDKKSYWIDEAHTSLRISGYTKAEVARQVFTGRLTNVRELHQYQAVNPEKSIIDTVKGLAIEEAQLPPLYFVMVRLWTQWFGSSVAVTRSLSALISLLMFPCIYWLCLELFDSPLVGSLAVMLVAVSPFHVLYAQEARMYSLWSVQILLSSAVFLRAIRLNTKLSWGIYSTTILLGLYTHLLSGLVTIGQGIYLVIIEKSRVTKKIFFWSISCLVAFLFFIPWILVIIKYSSQAQNAISWLETASLKGALISLLNNILNALMDFWFAYTYFPNLNVPNLRFGLYVKPLLLILVLYALFFICRKNPVKIWLFVLILTFFPPLLLLLRDIAANSGSIGQARYVISCYLGIQISLAYLFATQLSELSMKLWQKKFWQFTTVLLISSGILSCNLSSQAETWSNKYNYNYYPISRIVNQSDRPLLISEDRNLIQILCLSHLLAPKVQLQLIKTPKVTQINENFSDLFLFQPSERLRRLIEKQPKYKITPLIKVRGLWEIKN